MAIILINNTNDAIMIRKLGVSIDGLAQYTVNAMDYNQLIDDDDTEQYILNGDISVSDGYGILSPVIAIKHIQSHGLLRSVPNLYVPSYIDISDTPLQLDIQSNIVYFFTGSGYSQIVYLGNALTYDVTYTYYFYNLSNMPISIRCYTGETLVSVGASHLVKVLLYKNDTEKGLWIYTDTPVSIG